MLKGGTVGFLKKIEALYPEVGRFKH